MTFLLFSILLITGLFTGFFWGGVFCICVGERKGMDL